QTGHRDTAPARPEERRPVTSPVDRLDPRLEHLLAAWMPRQRWYPAKGRGVGIRLLGGTELPDPTGQASVQVLVVGLDSGDRLDVTQVPLTVRRTQLDGGDDALVDGAPVRDAPVRDALIGVLDDGTGPRWVYDGTHD